MKKQDDTVRLVAQEIKDLVGYCPSHPRKNHPVMAYAKYLFYNKLYQMGVPGTSGTRFIKPNKPIDGNMSNYYVKGRYIPPVDLTAKYGWYIGDTVDVRVSNKDEISGSNELLDIFSKMTPERRERLLDQARASYRVYKQERIKQLKQQINEKSTKV